MFRDGGVVMVKTRRIRNFVFMSIGAYAVLEAVCAVAHAIIYPRVFARSRHELEQLLGLDKLRNVQLVNYVQDKQILFSDVEELFTFRFDGEWTPPATLAIADDYDKEFGLAGIREKIQDGECLTGEGDLFRKGWGAKSCYVYRDSESKLLYVWCMSF